MVMSGVRDGGSGGVREGVERWVGMLRGLEGGVKDLRWAEGAVVG